MEGSENTDRKEIRRPMNAFLIFCKRHRRMVREKNSHLDNRSVTRILGELWANLNEEEKTVYTDLAKQYKEAFMKANPDYKWHNPEKVHPVVKSPTFKRKICGEMTSNDSIVPGKLADPLNMGGLNLLLMAGEHSFGNKDHSLTNEGTRGNKDHGLTNEGARIDTSQKLTESSQIGETPVVKPEREGQSTIRNTFAADPINRNSLPIVKDFSRYPDYSAKPNVDVSNNALLQLAEMCSSQLEDCSRQGVNYSRMPTFTYDTTSLGSPGQLPATFNKLNTLQPDVTIQRHTELITKEGDTEGLVGVRSDCNNSTTVAADCFACQSSPRTTNQLLYNLIVETPDHAPKQSPGGNNNDQIKVTSKTEDDQVMSCNKVVVDHIIDSLFTKDKDKPIKVTSIEDTLGRCGDPAQVKAIIKEKLKKISVTQHFEECMTQIIIDACASQILGKSKDTTILPDKNDKTLQKNNSLMSQLLQTGSYVSPVKNAVSVKDEIRNPQQKPEEGPPVMIKVEPVNNDKSFEAKMRLPKKRPYTESLASSTISRSSTVRPSSSNPVSSASPTRPATMAVSHHSPVADRNSYFCKFSGESQSTDTESSFQATRKSKRRNRGQRYLELINEGIIQPSKERLAAMRTESISSIDDSPSDEEWKQVIEEDKSESNLKPVCTEVDTTTASSRLNESELPRYKSGDFDLEAHIASLPVCSLDSLNRKKRRSNSNSTKMPSEKSPDKGSVLKSYRISGSVDMRIITQLNKAYLQGEELLTLYRPPHLPLQPSTANVTGSQRRKARKHSITHLIEVRTPAEITTQFSTIESDTDIFNRSLVEMKNQGGDVDLNDKISNTVIPSLTDEVFTVPASPNLTDSKEHVKKSLKNINKTQKPVKTFDVYEFSEESDTLLLQPLSNLQSPQKKLNLFGKRDLRPYQKSQIKALPTGTGLCVSQGLTDLPQINVSPETPACTENVSADCKKGGNFITDLKPVLPSSVHNTEESVSCRAVKTSCPFMLESSSQANVQYVVRDSKPGSEEMTTLCSNTNIQNSFTMASVHS